MYMKDRINTCAYMHDNICLPQSGRNTKFLHVCIQVQVHLNSYIGNRVSKLDLPLSKTSPIVVTSTPCIYEAKACIAMSTGNEEAYWSNDVSTRAVVAKRGKCIVRTTGHYSDAKYERIFFKSKSFHWNVFSLISSSCHHIYSFIPYNESYIVWRIINTKKHATITS